MACSERPTPTFAKLVSATQEPLPLDFERTYRIPGKHVQLMAALWHPGGFLLISDLARDTIWFWQPGGLPKVFRRPAGGPVGLALDPHGRLIVVEKLCNTVTRTEPDGAVIIVAETEDLGNNADIAAAVGDLADRLYVAVRTDAMAGFGPQKKGTLKCVVRNETVEEFGQEILVPLGLAWSEAEQTLWAVAGPDGGVWQLRRADGRWEADQLTTLWEDPEIDHAGIAVHPSGLVAVASEAGLFLLEGGRKLVGRVELAEPPGACSWGGPGGPDDLVVTAGCSVYVIPAVTR